MKFTAPSLVSNRVFLFEDLTWMIHLISPLASLIQEMNSDDPVVREKAVLETEKRLQFTEGDQVEDECRTTVNKTMISPPQAPMKVPFPYRRVIYVDPARKSAWNGKEWFNLNGLVRLKQTCSLESLHFSQGSINSDIFFLVFLSHP